tara:strand:+ start:328 stop:1224 length:897 start_codon:yes stop_codon:yes gene_type:complete
MANKNATVANTASQSSTKDTKQTTAKAQDVVQPTQTIPQCTNYVNSYVDGALLKEDDVVLLRAETSENDEKIILVIQEYIPKHRKSDNAEKTVELDLTLLGNLSDDRFSMSYTMAWIGQQIVDIKRLLGPLYDKANNRVVDLADTDLYEENEYGKTVLHLNILNPRMHSNKFRFRLKEVQRTQMRIKVNALTGDKNSWEFDNLNRTSTDNNGNEYLDSSAMQRGKGGLIIRHQGKPIFSDKKLVAVPNKMFPKHIILEQDEMVIDNLTDNYETSDSSEVTLGSEEPADYAGIPSEFTS